jgi:hypothetical protein
VHARFLRVLSRVFEVATAICFITVAVAFFTDPHATLVRSPIGRTVAPYDYVWNGFYAAGGVLAIFGLAENERRVETAGLIVLATGLLTNAVALASLNFDLRFFGYVAFAAASLARVVQISPGSVRRRHRSSATRSASTRRTRSRTARSRCSSRNANGSESSSSRSSPSSKRCARTGSTTARSAAS